MPSRLIFSVYFSALLRNELSLSYFGRSIEGSEPFLGHPPLCLTLNPVFDEKVLAIVNE
jgi:hypothetical protein